MRAPYRTCDPAVVRRRSRPPRGPRGAAAPARSRPPRSRRRRRAVRPRPTLCRRGRGRPGRRPAARRASARVTPPTSRMVWIEPSGRAGSPLIEIGTSPTPKACSIVNWPGAKASAAPSSGLEVQGDGVVGVPAHASHAEGPRQPWDHPDRFDSPARSTSVDTVGPVEVEQPYPRGLEAVVHHLGHPLQQRVAEALGPRRTWRAGSGVDADARTRPGPHARRRTSGTAAPATTSPRRRPRRRCRARPPVRARARRARPGRCRRTKNVSAPRPRGTGTRPAGSARCARSPSSSEPSSRRAPRRTGARSAGRRWSCMSAPSSVHGRRCGVGADGGRLLGDVDPDGAPGEAAAAADAAGRTELVDPGRQLVRHPLAVARPSGCSGHCRRAGRRSRR